MTRSEWLHIGGFGLLALAVGIWSPKVAYLMLGTLALIAIVDNATSLAGVFGAVTGSKPPGA